MNKIKSYCPECGVKFSATEAHIGQLVQCQKCQAAFVLEDPEAEPESQDSEEVGIWNEIRNEKTNPTPKPKKAPIRRKYKRNVVLAPFQMIRLQATLWGGAGILILFSGLCVSVMLFLAKDFNTGGGCLVASIIVSFFFFLIREQILLFVGIEENTRRTAEAIEQLAIDYREE